MESTLPEYSATPGYMTNNVHMPPLSQPEYATTSTSPLSQSMQSAKSTPLHGISSTLPTSPLSLTTLSFVADISHHRQSASFVPPPLERSPMAHVSGVTQTIRQKLQFTDEGKWKEFSARRLQLIDSMSLFTRKPSEQNDIIIAVADSLREEPPQTLPEFDKLVRAAVQSVRRNRKRLPKSKARSKLLSVKREGPRVETKRSGEYDGAVRSPPNPPKNATVHSEKSHFNSRPVLQSRPSYPVRSPTASTLSASSSTCSLRSPADEKHGHCSTGTEVGTNRRDNLPRALPSPLTFTSQSPILLELMYGDHVIPCTIDPNDLAGDRRSSLSFLLNTVRKTLSLPEDCPVALYHFRSSNGFRDKIMSEADANIAMRAAQSTASAVQALRLEVIAMMQVQTYSCNYSQYHGVPRLSSLRRQHHLWTQRDEYRLER
ncbi:transcription factor Vhr1-domain-containing protein [Lipomyces orientalis]|uniref:Transcription factor Vhr1-domain-containing protein n=1 Tax=Lipomyces orientalis TaxID=1233043 RepID=A0ACC3TT20_9ASCO